MKKELLLCVLAASLASACTYNPRSGKEYFSENNAYASRSNANRAYRYQGVDGPLYEGSRTKNYSHGCDYGNFPSGGGSGCGGTSTEWDYHSVTGQTIWPMQAASMQGYGTSCVTCMVTPPPPPPPPPCVTCYVQQQVMVPKQIMVPQQIMVPKQIMVPQQITVPVSVQPQVMNTDCSGCATGGTCLNQCVQVSPPQQYQAQPMGYSSSYNAQSSSSASIVQDVKPIPYNQVPSNLEGNNVGQ